VKKTTTELRESALDAVERSKTQVKRQKENLSAAVDAGRAAYRDAINNPIPD